jgi:hypothetical protein
VSYQASELRERKIGITPFDCPCDNPATAFGDDIRIVVDGQDTGGEFPIDKGQTHDLSEFVFDVDEESANIVFFEDNDHAADFDIEVTRPGKQRKDVAIKEGGYLLVIQGKDVMPSASGGLLRGQAATPTITTSWPSTSCACA